MTIGPRVKSEVTASERRVRSTLGSGLRQLDRRCPKKEPGRDVCARRNDGDVFAVLRKLHRRQAGSHSRDAEASSPPAGLKGGRPHHGGSPAAPQLLCQSWCECVPMVMQRGACRHCLRLSRGGKSATARSRVYLVSKPAYQFFNCGVR